MCSRPIAIGCAVDQVSAARKLSSSSLAVPPLAVGRLDSTPSCASSASRALPISVAGACRFRFAAGEELFPPHTGERFQKRYRVLVGPTPRTSSTHHHRLANELVQQLRDVLFGACRGGADGFGGRQRPATGEDRQTPEQRRGSGSDSSS